MGDPSRPSGTAPSYPRSCDGCGRKVGRGHACPGRVRSILQPRLVHPHPFLKKFGG